MLLLSKRHKVFVVLLVTTQSYFSCVGPEEKNPVMTMKSSTHTTRALDVEKGGLLAQQYCQSCHLLPIPAELNKNKWGKILPQMGIRLGIKNHQGESYERSVLSSNLIVPAQPAMDSLQWQQIIDYYEVNAPIFLPQGQRSENIMKEMPFFSLHACPDFLSLKQSLATFVRIDTSVRPTRILVANGEVNRLYLFSNRMKLLDSVTTPGPVVDMSFSLNEILVCMIGRDLEANDEKMGSIYKLDITGTGKMRLALHPLFDSLARPVQVVPVDLNGDHKIDYLICEFGNLEGALVWMENKGNERYVRHVISDLPGSIKAYVEYSPESHLPDIWVLFTQAREKISHYVNNRNGIFKEISVLKFPAVYGSSFFERVDLNHDGKKDIVYTCGDNGNATAILKPYHGVYLFLNDGKENYNLKYFYPLNGCYKALARDFNGNGRIDIATVSLYTDSRQREEGFVYFKNTGDLHFKPYSLPNDLLLEKAVTMDEGVIEENGKRDLLIGNAFFDSGPFGNHIREPLFYLLKNKMR